MNSKYITTILATIASVFFVTSVAMGSSYFLMVGGGANNGYATLSMGNDGQILSANSSTLSGAQWISASSALGLISTTTISIGGAALTAGNCTSTSVTINSATTTTGSIVDVSPQTYPGDGIFWKAYVSAANTVTVKACADTSTTPTASKYNIKYIP